MASSSVRLLALLALVAIGVQATAALALPAQYHALVAKRVGSSFGEVATVVEQVGRWQRTPILTDTARACALGVTSTLRS